MKKIWAVLFILGLLVLMGTAEAANISGGRWLIQVIIGAGLAVAAGKKGGLFE